MKNKGLIPTILLVMFIAILLTGSSFAFWIWESDRGNDTNVAFTTQGKNFSCSADGGGDITSNDILLEPAKCTDTSNAIVREIHTSIVNNTSESLRLDLWLDINSMDTELANSPNFKWAITDSNAGCEKGNVLGTGNFKNIGNQVVISRKMHSNSENNTYYLYIWLDEEETDASTAGKTFNIELGGTCTDDSSPNKPYINNSGLVPVKLSDTGDKVYTVSENDTSWYNYDDKKWANAILVSENTHTREYYKSNPGIEVPQSDILAYYVWIPRYSYKVWQYSGVSATGEEHEIDIKFVGNNTKEIATENGEYYTHPAFTFGNMELSGIWVGKFETSHTTLSSSTTANNLGCTEASCTNYAGLRILPNVKTLSYNNISNFFYASRFMESDSNPFGLDADIIDSHVMKNRDWGAVAYLSHSRYGINTEIGRNGCSLFITGCGITTPTGNWENTCSNAYGTIADYLQSTTGNVTGIFDMSGGTGEILMGAATVSNIANSDTGFLNNPDFKYFDRYTRLANCTLATCGGHALGETYNWYNDATDFVGDPLNWISRSGYLNSILKSGAFTYERSQPKAGVNRTSRLVLTEE